MKLLYLLLGSFWLSCSALWAQRPGEPVNPRQLKTAYLEMLIKTQVDSFRTAHGVHALQNDSVLYMAAVDHAAYLVKKNTGGHTQIYPSKATPQKRVEHYGGKDYHVGENVAITAVQRPLVKDAKHGSDAVGFIATYEEAARALFLQWYYSPGHRSNMLMHAYRLTAVALSVDTTQNKIVAVQQFAWKEIESLGK